jgi:hypothetical protein
MAPLLLVAMSALAGTQLELTSAPFSLSDDQGPDMGLAAKVKLSRGDTGMLVTTFVDGAGPDIYDVKGDAERPARDVFVRTCDSATVDCEDDTMWSAPINLSGTAQQSSMSTEWQGEGTGLQPYYGDSEKPNIFKEGAAVAISWIDHYCPGGEQRSVTYLERDNREVAFGCTYIAVSTDEGLTWGAPQQLSDGYRDAKQDSHRGSTTAWTVTWQEDPAGLALGEADGPGDGASGANTSNGTDIWYSYIARPDLTAGGSFSAPLRLTNNATGEEQKQGTTTMIEKGQEGASRPNLAMVGPTVLVAYEETKGSGGVDSGKYVRYHVFPWNTPPTSCEPGTTGCLTNARGEALPAVQDPARAGCILSDPNENARRVRFFAQGTPGPNTGLKLHIFWKQGLYDQGGPSDIIARSGFLTGGETGPLAGLGFDDFDPPVAVPTAMTFGDTLDGCYIPGDSQVGDGAQGNAPGWNLSADTETGGDLLAMSDDNNSEDARAHRGVMSGDFIMLGYSYTPDWAVARYTDLENYEFWARTSTNGGQTWTAPKDLSSKTTAMVAAELGLQPSGVNVKEPRIVKTPGSGPQCPTGIPTDPTTTNPEHCRAPGTVLIAWGTETNVYEHLGGSVELDMFVTRTTDKGATYEPIERFGGALEADGESQLQITPDGKQVWATWNQAHANGQDALFVGLYETLSLSVSAPVPGTAGVVNEWTVSDGTPGAKVFLAVSTQEGVTNVPGCPGVALGLDRPTTVSSDVVDANGDVVLSRIIPAGMAGREVFFQAVEKATCRISPVVQVTL